jgi:Dolichyl-phosphate-mannose-protein mannosyltransferase
MTDLTPGPSPQAEREIGRRGVILLFCLLAVLYALTYRGNIDVIDEAMMIGATASIAERGTAQINSIYPALLPWGAPASDPDSPIYSKYPLGQSLLAVPLYAVGRLLPISAVKMLNDQPFVPLAPFLTAILLNTLATVLTALALFFTVPLWGFSRRTGALVAVLYSVTTLAWPYAKTFYVEPTTACALAWMVYFAVRYRCDHHLRDGLIAGGCLGLAILLRTTSVIFVPLLLVYLFPQWIAPLPGVAAGVALTLGYNFYRFGSLFETGYEPGFGRAPWEALAGYVISPSRSIFLFNPVLLLAIPGAWWLAARARRDVLFILGLIFAQVGIYSAWWAWDGGASLGPRFLVPAIPLGMLLVAPVVERPRWRGALVGLAVLGFGVQVLCNLANPNDVFYETVDQHHVTLSAVNWQIGESIPANLWNAYSRHQIDSLVFRYLPPRDPVAKAILFAAVSALLAGAMVWLARGQTPADLISSDLSRLPTAPP